MDHYNTDPCDLLASSVTYDDSLKRLMYSTALRNHARLDARVSSTIISPHSSAANDSFCNLHRRDVSLLETLEQYTQVDMPAVWTSLTLVKYTTVTN